MKIVFGEIAEFISDIDTALGEYQQALGATNPATKALAYYRRAKAFERKSADESLAHYAYAIRLLEKLLQSGQYSAHATAQKIVSGQDVLKEERTLLARTYIDRTLIFIQIRPDLKRVENDLVRAQALRILIMDCCGSTCIMLWESSIYIMTISIKPLIISRKHGLLPMRSKMWRG